MRFRAIQFEQLVNVICQNKYRTVLLILYYLFIIYVFNILVVRKRIITMIF